MIEIQNLSFRYRRSDFRLAIESLKIESTEKVAIVGPSGSGKTTLLNLLAGIYVADSGSISVAAHALERMSDAARRNFRISEIGMVFQQFDLVEYLTAYDNIRLPYFINAALHLTSEVGSRARQLAADVGIADKLNRRPSQLSQGEQQRVAICRALIACPKLILADEPTGNLDPSNKRLILNILFEQAQQNNQTLIVVTHDMGILDGFDRTIDFEAFLQTAPAKLGAL